MTHTCAGCAIGLLTVTLKSGQSHREATGCCCRGVAGRLPIAFVLRMDLGSGDAVWPQAAGTPARIAQKVDQGSGGTEGGQADAITW